MMDNAALRDTIKTRRNSLTQTEVLDASIEIARLVWQVPGMMRAKRIACYFPFGGEIDPRPIAAEAWRRGRKLFLPVLSGPELKFAPYSEDSVFLRNFLGIPEPVHTPSTVVPPAKIDVVLAPMVAFDASGNRLGMGGGYYDRSLRFLRHRNALQRPIYVGLGHEFQKAAKIKAFSWDISLHYAVTEKEIYKF